MLPSKQYLDLAARLALRGMGLVEPNPMVGAVLVKDGRVIGVGHHRRFGHLHAEREALESARRQGHDPRGSTLYVTLEPCSHHGKQPPCTDAIIGAGVSRVVFARADPNPVARGGAEALNAAGVPAELSTESPFATAVSLPFIQNITTDLPFVFAKWAQTHDGRLITRADEPRWITGRVARRRVHALRGRVDAVLTGVGTVLADNPRLTARDVRTRRTARRVIIDTHLRTPPGAALFADVGRAPVHIFTSRGAAESPRAAPLRAAGAQIHVAPDAGGRLDLRHSLRALREHCTACSVMVEAGPTLLGSLFTAGLIDAAVVQTAPSARSNGDIPAPADTVGGSTAHWLAYSRRVGADTERLYLRHTPTG